MNTDTQYQFYPWIESGYPSIEDLRQQIKKLEEQLERKRLEDRKRQLEEMLRYPRGRISLSVPSPDDYHTGDFPPLNNLYPKG